MWDIEKNKTKRSWLHEHEDEGIIYLNINMKSS
jgi:hypothetical protein